MLSYMSPSDYFTVIHQKGQAFRLTEIYGLRQDAACPLETTMCNTIFYGKLVNDF